jgi:hypothetical protein
VRSLEKGDLYEAIWLIYTLRGLNIPISDRTLFELAGDTRSSAVALILLDMRARGSINGKLPIPQWEGQIDADTVLTDWTWLLAYEAFRRGWLADPRSLMTKPFFAAMRSRGVVFYDERRNVRKRTEMAKLRRALRRRFQKEVRQFLFAVREVEFESDY